MLTWKVLPLHAATVFVVIFAIGFTVTGTTTVFKQLVPYFIL